MEDLEKYFTGLLADAEEVVALTRKHSPNFRGEHEPGAPKIAALPSAVQPLPLKPIVIPPAAQAPAPPTPVDKSWTAGEIWGAILIAAFIIFVIILISSCAPRTSSLQLDVPGPILPHQIQTKYLRPQLRPRIARDASSTAALHFLRRSSTTPRSQALRARRLTTEVRNRICEQRY